MLLVLICLAAATIAAAAYISSRDNSALIGDNVAASAAARWAASSGLELAVATLETNWDWRSLHVGGALFANLDVAGANVTVEAQDILTKSPPSANTTYVRLASTADVGGISQTASAVLYVPKVWGSVVAIDLAEFAAFASETLEVRENAKVTRWPKSPLSPLGGRVYFGTLASESSAVDVRDDAAAIDVTAYAPPDASNYLVSVANGPDVPMVKLPDRIPFPAAPTIVGIEESVWPPPPLISISSGQRFSYAADTRARRVEVSGNGTIALLGEITMVIEEDLRLLQEGTLEVDGDVRVIVFGNLRIDEGNVVLMDNASLTIFVKGRSGTSVEIRDGYLGDAPSESTTGSAGEAAWMDPQRLTIYSIPSESSLNWRVRGRSTIKGSLYASDVSRVRVEERAGVYGRIAARNIELRNDAVIFYCPSLNTHNGYTNLSSPLYDEDGRLKEEFRTLTSLDAIVLEPIATTTRTVIKAGSRLLGETDDDTTTSPDDPTPRDGSVLYNPLAFGSDVSIWEGEL